MRRCIFHVPYKLDYNGVSAPMIRPRKMIQGFLDIGYEVDVVEGIGSERKEKIKNIKARIESGIEYDFMYAESSTMPNLLTEQHHLPTHPFLDFSFFHFLKNKNIKIGLFYRDIYWKFDSYKSPLPAWKSFLAIQCYKYELKKYEQLLNKFYLPSWGTYDYLKSTKFDTIVDVLPPGCENPKRIDEVNEIRDFKLKPLNIFYVGGLGEQYQIYEILKAVKGIVNCNLTICCRKEEWEGEKNKEWYLASNIQVIHKKSAELVEYYKQSDICSLLFKNNILRTMAIPYKAFEYLTYAKPVLVTCNTAIGAFVAENDIGWSLEYDAPIIRNKILDILDNPNQLHEKKCKCIEVRAQNTWEKRALHVVSDLTLK